MKRKKYSTFQVGFMAAAVALVSAGAAHAAPAPEDLVLKSFAFKKNLAKAPNPWDPVNVPSTAAAVVGGATNGSLSVKLGFEGTSDYDTRALGIGLIPPDTMGAVGTTQYVQLLNGSFSVYDKTTGALVAPRKTDSQFWTAAGGSTTGGDPRILFDSTANRWLAVGFNTSGSGLNIGVSQTADATGAWKAASFNVFPAGIADYPTMAISGNSIVIGTNNFSSVAGGGFSYSGTSLLVLPKSDIFNAAGPVLSGLQTFTTPYVASAFVDRGYAIQGVNTTSTTGPIRVVAASAGYADAVTYDVTGAGTPGAAQTAVTYLTDKGGATYDGNSAGRQPTNNGSARVVDTSDDRVASNAWEVNGKIYFTHTVTPTGTDNTVVRIVVMDAATKNVLSETDINDPSGNFDFYQGSLAVNSSGQVVVGYNRSGSFATGVDGRISIFARGFNTNANGTLSMTGDVLLKQSLVSDYHNGSPEGADPAGRQRWGDYSSVTLDPTDSQSFWVIGQFAREFNNAGGGHPGGSGFARWGNWISEVGVTAVPEPSTYLLMALGLVATGFAARRRKAAELDA
jgi:PEP-CTERM motif